MLYRDTNKCCNKDTSKYLGKQEIKSSSESKKQVK